MVIAEKHYCQRHFLETDQVTVMNQWRNEISRMVPVRARDNFGKKDVRMLSQRMHLNGVLAMSKNNEVIFFKWRNHHRLLGSGYSVVYRYRCSLGKIASLCPVPADQNDHRVQHCSPRRTPVDRPRICPVRICRPKEHRLSQFLRTDLNILITMACKPARVRM